MSTLNQQLKKLFYYVHLMRLDKPIGFFLLLWPTLWALWIANLNKKLNFKLWGLFIIGTITMRSAGCVINDIADRNFDSFVERTRYRPLATKTLTITEALFLFITLSLIALFIVRQLNSFSIYLSIVGLALVLIYPFTKRVIYWPQFFLGLAFAWGIPLAFAAQMNTIPFIGWILFIATFFWILSYDTIYAMVDSKDDKKIGIKSTALLFEKNSCLLIGITQFLFLSLLVFVGYYLQLNLFYYLCLFLSMLLIFYQQYLIKDYLPVRCFKAFLNNNYVGAIIFLGFYGGSIH